MTPEDYADQRRGPDALTKRHLSAEDLAFWCIVASGAVSVIAQWWV